MLNEKVDTPISQLEWLAKTEAQLADKYAKQALKNAQESAKHIYAMYDHCHELFLMGAHQQVGKTWQEYFTDLTGYSSSRYYQVKRIRDLAHIIEQETGNTPFEWELRQFPRDVSENASKRDIVALYDVAMESARQRNSGKQVAPKEADYNTAQEVIQEIRATIIPDKQTNTERFVSNSIAENINEKIHRSYTHIESGSKWQTVSKQYVSIGYRAMSRVYPVRKRRNERNLLIHRKLKGD